ncbi:hypothetical protein TNCV_3561971 [Trichonephila clavipes]|nr:hypothetical protein TNCV_3561971 [Trichonephila clavipes]
MELLKAVDQKRRNRFRSSGLSPYIHNGELSSKAVKRRQWAEEARPSVHVSDTCWFVKKPGWKNREKKERRKREREKEGKRARKKTRAGRFRKRRGESQSFVLTRNPKRE